MRIWEFIRQCFLSKYKKLLRQIEVAKNNEQQLRLSNGILLDFTPGHEYDALYMSVLPHTSDNKRFADKYFSQIGQVVRIEVYDSFGGDVRVLAVGEDRILVEIVDVLPCYPCQIPPVPGAKYWIGDWEIPPEPVTKVTASASEDNELPF